MRTRPAVGCSSTTVATSYGSTPGMKSVRWTYASLRNGTISAKVMRHSWVSGIPAFFMNSTWGGSIAVIA